MSRLTRIVIWNGKNLPPEFRQLPAGRYLVEAVEDDAYPIGAFLFWKVEPSQAADFGA